MSFVFGLKTDHGVFLDQLTIKLEANRAIGVPHPDPKIRSDESQGQNLAVTV